MKSPIDFMTKKDNSIINDSEITDVSDEARIDNNPGAVELINITSHSLLYRIRKDGKYFIIKKTAINGKKGQEILRREYEMSIGCDHPNIIHVYEYRKAEESGGEVVMEYVEGRNLNEFLAENPSLATRKRIFNELLDAVGYLHQRRIIHNDLKPENILIGRNSNRLKLIDMGLSDDDAHYAVKTPGFTSGYAAPELINDRKSDIRSDIYSLGILMRQIFGKRFSSIARKAANKDPNKRFNGVESLRSSLKREKLKLIIPGLAAFVIILFCLGGVLLNYNSDKIESLENKVKMQADEIKSQSDNYNSIQKKYSSIQEEYTTIRQKYDSIREKYNSITSDYNSLQENYSSTSRTSDSLSNIIEKNRNHERLKQERIAGFQKSLKKAAAIALDSIKKSHSYVEKSPIRYNFKVKARQLYDSAEKIVDGENIDPILYSIMQSEIEIGEKSFSPFFKVKW